MSLPQYSLTDVLTLMRVAGQQSHRDVHGGGASSAVPEGEWARSIPDRNSRNSRPSNPNASLGDWIDSAVVADESVVEKPTVHPSKLKRKRLIEEIRKKENFKKPKFHEAEICILCEYGPVGVQETDESDNPYLWEFHMKYKLGLGNTNWLQHYRSLQGFWNKYIATPREEIPRLDPDDEPIPEVRVSDLQLHFEKHCVGRNVERIVLDQIDDILLIQKTISENGLFVTVVDGQEHEEPESIPMDDVIASENDPVKKKIRPLINHKPATQWREYNRSLLYSIKTLCDLQNADHQGPKSNAKGNGMTGKGKKAATGPTQATQKTFGRNY